MSVEPRFVSIEDAASRLAVSPSTIRRWIEDNTVPAIKVGNSWRIPVRWFAQLEQAAMKEGGESA